MQMPEVDESFYDPFRISDSNALPPRPAMFALLSLASADEIAKGAGYSIRTHTRTGQVGTSHWDLFAVAAGKLLHVHAEAPITHWAWENEYREHTLRSWSKPIRAIDSVAVSHVNLAGGGGGAVWKWDVTYDVSIDGSELTFPIGDRSDSHVERGRLETFTDALLKAYNTTD